MKKLHLTLLVAVLAGVSAILWSQARTNEKFRVELARLHEKNRALNSLHREHEQLVATAPIRAKNWLSDEPARARLHRQIDALQAQVAQAEAAREKAAAQSFQPGPPPPPRPVSAGMMTPAMMQNVGRETPAAAWQTFTWAMRECDARTVADGIFYDEQSRPWMERAFAALPEDERLAYGTPEGMMAAVLFARADTARHGDATGPAMGVASQTLTSADTMSLVYRIQDLNGDIHDVPPLQYRRFGDGWKLIVPPQAFEMTKAMLAALPPTQREQAVRK